MWLVLSITICFEELSKIIKILYQEFWSLSQEWHPGPSEYEAGIPNTQLQCLVCMLEFLIINVKCNVFIYSGSHITTRCYSIGKHISLTSGSPIFSES